VNRTPAYQSEMDMDLMYKKAVTSNGEIGTVNDEWSELNRAAAAIRAVI